MHLHDQQIGVMLVDDHKIVLWGLRRLLEGAEPALRVVASASTLEEAHAALAGCTPDVVLLDLDLNGVCSLALLPSLLAREQTRVLVFSGSRDEALHEQAIRAGARGLLRKDACPELVIKAIRKVHNGELWIEHAMLARVQNDFRRAGPAPRRPDPEAARLASLTLREHKIVGAVVAGNGAPNHVLAQSLFISEHTLRNHLVSIYKKLGVRNRLELYVYALNHQLGVPDCSAA